LRERFSNVPKPIKESAPVKPRRHRARRTEIWFWCLSMWIVTLCSKPPWVDQIKFLKSIPVVLGKPQIHTHHCKFRHRRNAGTCPLRASPCNHSNLDISANSPKLRKPPPSASSCRSRQQHPRQQRPRNFRLRPQSQRIALSSALPAALTISKRPARSRKMDKKTSGSHGTGSLDGLPPLLRQKVSSRAPPIAQHFVECAPTRTLARPTPHQHIPP
jgi:hypothetical protein